MNGTDDKCHAEAGVEPVSMPGVDALTDRGVSSWHGSLYVVETSTVLPAMH